jgi:hypothetical protein
VVSVRIPDNNVNERKYILDIILGEFLGLEFELSVGSQDYEIELENKQVLTIKDTFFNKYPNDLEYLKLENIPKEIEELDIFAASFFMLTRWEEYVNRNRDNHDRFPANESFAFKNNFLDRPIVNEYLEILKILLLQLDCGLTFKQYKFTKNISCDVDIPYETYTQSVIKTIKKVAGDIVKRKNIKEAVQTIINYTASKFNNYSYDPMNTFEWIMEMNEKSGNKVVFYFLVENTIPEFDGNYNIDEPRIRQLIRTIDKRGHEIGLHGSYSTYKNKNQIQQQLNILQRVIKEEGIEQKHIGIRQHYLRWSTPETANNIDKARITYDTTLGYADHAGFRCGTCYEYPFFDIQKRKRLNLLIRPLVIMECSVLGGAYMNMDIKSAEEYMQKIKNKIKKVDGNFTLLWHNGSFIKKDYRNLYKCLIR